MRPLASPPASPARVTVQTLLGDNAVRILADLAAHLERETGLEVRFEGGDGARASNDGSVWDHDLVWACGLVTARALARREFAGDVVAAPVFAGETRAVYRSVVVARSGGPVRRLSDLARARVAVNETASWSGYRGPLAELARAGPPRAFGETLLTGTHRASVEAVAAGRADAAAIDCTVWEHLARTDTAATDRVIVVDRTGDWPAPPFSLADGLDPDVRARLTAALTTVRPGQVPGLEAALPAVAASYEAMLGAPGRGGGGGGGVGAVARAASGSRRRPGARTG